MENETHCEGQDETSNPQNPILNVFEIIFVATHMFIYYSLQQDKST